MLVDILRESILSLNLASLNMSSQILVCPHPENTIMAYRFTSNLKSHALKPTTGTVAMCANSLIHLSLKGLALMSFQMKVEASAIWHANK